GSRVSRVYLFFVVSDIPSYFFVIPAYGAGVPITTGLKGRVPAAQGFREKYRKPLGARKIFPRNPKGLTLHG
ncbi:MAG: hypothetical protein OSJ56_15195, partial [Prevotella sp.]|nr:hypothetical protein [Prevotella sp.]